jgi:hypothetical protein
MQMVHDADRSRRIRSTALRLALFALVVYIGFIVAFVYSRS